MGLSREEIIDYALRYISRDEISDFPRSGELFCMLEREIPTDRVLDDNEGWNFAGYHFALEYTLDEEARPMGKWLFLRFISLLSFPPAIQTLKLQPPHVVKGRFHSADRSHEIRMVKIDTSSLLSPTETAAPPLQTPRKTTEIKAPVETKILRFRPKGKAQAE